MTRSPLRVRLAIGSCIVVAGLGVALVGNAASASTPPSEPPTADTGDAGTSPADGDHDALVETIVSTSAESGLPMDRDCVAGIVGQLPAESVATVLAQIEASAAVADLEVPEIELPNISMPDLGDITIPDFGEIELPELSIPDLGDISIPDLGDIEIPEISLPELPDLSLPELPDLSLPEIPDIAVSAETLQLSRDLIVCVDGDADPALVEQVVALAESSAPAGMLDPECTSKILSTFPDEVLQQIIDSGGVQADPSAVDPAIAAEVAKLLACTDMTGVAPSVAAEAPAEVEATPVTTA